MIRAREFKPDTRGRIFGTLLRLVGNPIFTHDAKRIVRNLERLESSG